MYKKIRNRYRRIKWWFMRANGKMPPCDWWDYHCTLVKNIEQGLTGLLYEGVTDWDAHKKEKEELEFILAWAKEWLDDMYSNHRVHTPEKQKELDDKTKKAFRLLAKNLYFLWD